MSQLRDPHHPFEIKKPLKDVPVSEPERPYTRLTIREVYERAYNVIRSHQARTALDLTREETLRIAVSHRGYDDLRAEAGETPLYPRVEYRGMHLYVGGIRVVADEHLAAHELRVRTELEG